MSADPIAPKFRFPIGLTLAVAIAFAILVGLGVWQVKRLAWKEALLAHIAALKTAPAQPIATVLARLKAGENVEWTRVDATCAPPKAVVPDQAHYALRDGKIVWRAVSACALADGPYGTVLLDRGYDEATAGQMEPPALRLPPAGHVEGLLRSLAATSGEDPRKAAPSATGDGRPGVPELRIVVEHEDPAPPGVTPSALPEKIANNHLSYALTWFGLAGALLAVYAAMLFRRLKTAA